MADDISVINQYTQLVKELEKEVNKIGTKRDSQTIRDNVSRLIPQCNEISQSNQAMFSSGQKLANDYQLLNQEVKRLQQEYKNKVGLHPLKATTHTITETKTYENTTSTTPVRHGEPTYTSMPNEQTALLEEEHNRQQQQQQQQQLQQDRIPADELDFYTIVQEDRSQQISRIHSSVQEVNAIFKQLGTLVKEQGTQVDSVDENISHFSDNMKRANDQLTRADEHQRQRNRCGLLTLVIIIIVTSLIILGALS